MVRPFDAPSPKPAGNSINRNHDDERPTLGKTSPSISIKNVLATNHIATILSRKTGHSFTTTDVTNK